MNEYEFTQKIINGLLERNSSADHCRHGGQPDPVGPVLPAFDKRRSVLLVLQDADFEPFHVLNELATIEKGGLCFDAVLSHDLMKTAVTEDVEVMLHPRRLFDMENVPLCNIADKSLCAVVPFLSQNDIVKLSLGIQDSAASSLLWLLLWKNMPFFTDLRIMKRWNCSCENIFLGQMNNEYIEKLISMGVTDVAGNGYSGAVSCVMKECIGERAAGRGLIAETAASRVVTEKDVLNTPSDRKVIYVSARTIVTPLAVDAAKKKGIDFVAR